MGYSTEEMLQLMVQILGGNVDNATGWKTTGPASGRNALLTSERVVTRAINDIDNRLASILATVDGFNNRFDVVVGENYTSDEEAFNEIGSNIIIAVNNIKKILDRIVPKVDSIDIDAINAELDSLLETVNNKANQADVDGLTASLGIKADKSDVDDLALMIENKIDKRESIIPGSATKVQYDEQGLITKALPLVSEDIPNIEVSQVNGLQALLDAKMNNNSISLDINEVGNLVITWDDGK